MKILIYRELNQNKILNTSTRHYMKILDYNKINYDLVEYDDLFLERLDEADYFIFRLNFYDDNKRLGFTLIDLIDKYLGVKSYPTSNQIYTYDDKIRQKLLLDKFQIPRIDTNIFFDKAAAMDFVETAEYPFIFKLKGGAGSMNVMLIESKRQAKLYVRQMFGDGISPERSFLPGTLRREYFDLKREVRRFLGDGYRRIKGYDHNPTYNIEKNYFYAQKFLPQNDFDIRITVIDGKAFAFRRFNRPGDFRASGSGEIDYDQKAIPKECITQSFILAERLALVCIAIDFLFDGGEFKVVEFSYTFDSKAVATCPGYWDRSGKFHEASFIPEYLQLRWLFKGQFEDGFNSPAIAGFYD